MQCNMDCDMLRTGAEIMYLITVTQRKLPDTIISEFEFLKN